VPFAELVVLLLREIVMFVQQQTVRQTGHELLPVEERGCHQVCSGLGRMIGFNRGSSGFLKREIRR